MLSTIGHMCHEPRRLTWVWTFLLLDLTPLGLMGLDSWLFHLFEDYGIFTFICRSILHSCISLMLWWLFMFMVKHWCSYAWFLLLLLVKIKTCLVVCFLMLQIDLVQDSLLTYIVIQVSFVKRMIGCSAYQGNDPFMHCIYHSPFIIWVWWYSILIYTLASLIIIFTLLISWMLIWLLLSKLTTSASSFVSFCWWWCINALLVLVIC